MVKKIALYLRSSKDRHDVSVDSQRREMEKFAAQHNSAVVCEFVDKVESAKTDDRPAFQAMISEAKSKDCRFNEILCYDTSRFSRKQYHAQMYKQLLKKKGISVNFYKLPKTGSMVDSLIESIMEIFDEFHSTKSKMDGLRGMKENINQGWRAGGCAIMGYKLDKEIIGTREGQPITKSKLIPDPKHFNTVQKYLKGRAINISRNSLKESLNLKVSFSTLVYMEDSALTYSGHTVWNKHNEKIDGNYVGGKRYRDRDEWVINRNTHEAMITEEEAEAILASRHKQSKKQKRYTRKNYLLSSLAKCSCGASLDGESGYYRCHDRCGAKGIKQETLEQAVLNLILNELLSDNNLALLKDEIEIAQKSIKPAENHIKAQLEKEVKEIDRQVSELISLLTQIKNRTPLLERIDSLEDEKISLNKNLIEFKNDEGLETKIISGNDLDSFFKQYRKDMNNSNVEKKKAVIRNLVSDMVFDGDNLDINPNLQFLTEVKLASPRGRPLSY